MKIIRYFFTNRSILKRALRIHQIRIKRYPLYAIEWDKFSEYVDEHKNQRREMIRHGYRERYNNVLKKYALHDNDFYSFNKYANMETLEREGNQIESFIKRMGINGAAERISYYIADISKAAPSSEATSDAIEFLLALKSDILHRRFNMNENPTVAIL